MPLFFGYPGTVWAAAYASLDWLQSQLNSAATPAAATNAASVVFQTLRNGSEAINIYQAARAANISESNLSQIAALTLSLDPVTQAYFTARYVSMGNFMVALDAMQVAIPSPLLVPGLLANGSPAIAYGGLLEYYMNPLAVTGGLIETPPTGLSSSTFAADTALNATVYQTLAQAVAAVQGANLTLAYDAATQMYSAGCMTLKRQSDFTSNSFNFTGAYSLAQMWNLQVALPSILNAANMITSSPQSATSQQCGTIAYILDQFMFQLAVFLLSLRRNTQSQVNLVQVQQNDTVMDIAARATTNFENWQSVVTANNLSPPWTGPGSLAPQGTQLLIPSSNEQLTTTTPVNYAANILGTDFDFGPINGNMPTWQGDYQLISGLNNYRRALGRRLQTTLSSLIYHTEYGCRIPPEVGSIQYSDTIGHIAAYGQSALASDPRTAQVISAKASTGANFSVFFNGTVQPIGPQSTPVSVNETLAPAV